MSSDRNNPTSAATEDGVVRQPSAIRGVAGDESPARFAHELANLLDGSLRNVGLALATLRDMDAAQGTKHPHDAESDEALTHRLEAANSAMSQMAMLLHRWMQRSRTPDTLHAQTKTLCHVIEHAVRLLKPAAQAHGIAVNVHVSSEAAQLPAGPLYPAIANGLRNAIESISQGVPAHERATRNRIDLACDIQAGEVIIRILDDGPGLTPSLIDERGQFRFGATTKANGHGLGLALARDIASRLGGQIELRNCAPHESLRGAAMTIRFPVRGISEVGT